MTKQTFIQTMEAAWNQAKNKNVNKAVLFAQAALETGWGGGLFTAAFNIFGIKAGKGWKGQIYEAKTKEWSKVTGWYTVLAKWRKYSSLASCIEDYTHMINTCSWYKDALPFVNGPADEFLRHILPGAHEPGWATDPQYFEKVKATGQTIERLGGPRWI